MATVVRKFQKGAAETARGKGRMRADYGAAMKAKTAGLDQAARNYNAGIISARDYTTMQIVYAEQALGSTASGINALTEGLNKLMPLSDKQMGAMKLMSGSMMTLRALMAMYRVWGAYLASKKTKQVALAAGETTAALAAQQYHKVAIALTAVGVFGAGFAAGYIGAKAMDGGTVDISTSYGRREAGYRMQEAGMVG